MGRLFAVEIVEMCERWLVPAVIPFRSRSRRIAHRRERAKEVYPWL
jgi:hypothetical protein